MKKWISIGAFLFLSNIIIWSLVCWLIVTNDNERIAFMHQQIQRQQVLYEWDQESFFFHEKEEELARVEANHKFQLKNIDTDNGYVSIDELLTFLNIK